VRGRALPPGAGFTTPPALVFVSVQVTVLSPIPDAGTGAVVAVVVG
jgi:hypothetical protein